LKKRKLEKKEEPHRVIEERHEETVKDHREPREIEEKQEELHRVIEERHEEKVKEHHRDPRVIEEKYEHKENEYPTVSNENLHDDEYNVVHAKILED